VIRLRRASKAARQARDAVIARNTESELEAECQRAEQLVQFLQAKRCGEARLCSAELLSGLTQLAERREVRLGKDRDALLTAREQVRIICSAIDEGAPHDPDAGHRRILGAAREKVVMLLRAVRGRAGSAVDEGRVKRG
jgi:hypothetical protein